MGAVESRLSAGASWPRARTVSPWADYDDGASEFSDLDSSVADSPDRLSPSESGLNLQPGSGAIIKQGSLLKRAGRRWTERQFILEPPNLFWQRRHGKGWHSVPLVDPSLRNLGQVCGKLFAFAVETRERSITVGSRWSDDVAEWMEAIRLASLCAPATLRSVAPRTTEVDPGQPLGVLFVEVVEARDLLAGGERPLSNAYAVVRFHLRSHRTTNSSSPNPLHPVWRQNFEVPVVAEASAEAIHVEIWDAPPRSVTVSSNNTVDVDAAVHSESPLVSKDSRKHDRLIGAVAIPLYSLDHNRSHDDWFPMHEPQQAKITLHSLAGKARPEPRVSVGWVRLRMRYEASILSNFYPVVVRRRARKLDLAVLSRNVKRTSRLFRMVHNVKEGYHNLLQWQRPRVSAAVLGALTFISLFCFDRLIPLTLLYVLLATLSQHPNFPYWMAALSSVSRSMAPFVNRAAAKLEQVRQQVGWENFGAPQSGVLSFFSGSAETVHPPAWQPTPPSAELRSVPRITAVETANGLTVTAVPVGPRGAPLEIETSDSGFSAQPGASTVRLRRAGSQSSATGDGTQLTAAGQPEVSTLSPPQPVAGRLIVFEIQRRRHLGLFGGFSYKTNSKRGPWTDERGTPVQAPREIVNGVLYEWQPEVGPNTDKDGWTYGVLSFKGEFSPTRSPVCFIRRRRWIGTPRAPIPRSLRRSITRFQPIASAVVQQFEEAALPSTVPQASRARPVGLPRGAAPICMSPSAESGVSQEVTGEDTFETVENGEQVSASSSIGGHNLVQVVATKGLRKGWKMLKALGFEAQEHLDHFCTYWEKRRNMFTWKDPCKTRIVCYALSVLVVLSWALPLRVLFLAAVWGHFMLGWHRSKKLVRLRHRYQLLVDSFISRAVGGAEISAASLDSDDELPMDAAEMASRSRLPNPAEMPQAARLKLLELLRAESGLELTDEELLIRGPTKDRLSAYLMTKLAELPSLSRRALFSPWHNFIAQVPDDDDVFAEDLNTPAIAELH